MQIERLKVSIHTEDSTMVHLMDDKGLRQGIVKEGGIDSAHKLPGSEPLPFLANDL